MVRPMHRWGDIFIMGLKFVWRSWTGMIWLRMGPVVASCGYCNEPWGSIKCREFLD